MPEFLRAAATISLTIGPSLAGSSICSMVGPRRQPSQTAMMPLPAWNTRAVMSCASSLALLGREFAQAFGHARLRRWRDCVHGDAVAFQFARRDDAECRDAGLRRP